jgi:hypothetical protein
LCRLDQQSGTRGNVLQRDEGLTHLFSNTLALAPPNGALLEDADMFSNSLLTQRKIPDPLAVD